MNSFENDTHYFLEICKKRIEKKLNWSATETWRQRDYLNLINLIEKETGVNLSLSTVKRIWNKNHHAIPQKTTLDTLASFLGYGDWLEFKSSNGRSTGNDIKIPKPKKSKKSVIFPLSTIVILTVLAFATFNMDRKKEEMGNKATLSSRITVPSNVPNTVLFNFELAGIEGDSFFIQQSWNELEKVQIDPKDSILTKTYYYPGPHEATLLADNKVIAKTNLNITTDDWVALSKKDNKDIMPVYLDIDRSVDKGVMSIDKSQLLDNHIPLNPELILSYYYVKDFYKLDSNNFRIGLRIKNERLLKTNCPKVHLGILGSSNACFIPLTIPGCVGEINLRIGDKRFEGRRTDLSPFGIDIFEWQNLEFIKTNREYAIMINNELVFSAKENETIGEIEGIMINFSGIGSVDYVKIDNPKTLSMSYFEEF
ncbi:MAG: hypothetical protein AAGF96_13455 [Bacteroidota bacterium]